VKALGERDWQRLGRPSETGKRVVLELEKDTGEERKIVSGFLCSFIARPTLPVVDEGSTPPAKAAVETETATMEAR